MKCYFAIVAPEKEADVYVNMLEVAIKSAQQNTSLQICVLYDGPTEHYCYRMLKKYGVQIINHTFSHEKDIYRLFDKDFCGRTKDPKLIASTFMRMDIPFLEQEEEYVLYTDVDVVFARDVRPEDLPRPEVLAACGEFSSQKDMNAYFNAGILLLNVKNMRRYCEMIFQDLENGVVVKGFDQGYLNKYCHKERTWLPVEYNWKPYWGINKDAVIIHYHGLKPGGTNETSGFGMSDRIIMNTTKSGSNLAGYAYYYSIYFHILDSVDTKIWMEWLANLLGLALDLRLAQQEEFLKTAINKERAGGYNVS